MITNISDVHCHFDETVFNDDRENVLRQQHKNGVDLIINSGSSVPSSERSLTLASQFSFVYASVGVFPLEAYSVPDNWLEEIERMAHDSRCVAIGEIGLDYHRDDGSTLTVEKKACQQKVFEEQLILATKLHLPVVIHDREADEDVITLLKKHPVRGMIHRFFSETEYGRTFLKMGYSLGIGPQITYGHSEKLVDIVKEMPVEQLLLETDCPFLPPQILEGQRATSDMIAYVCEKVAEVRDDVTPQQVADIARENARRMFGV